VFWIRFQLRPENKIKHKNYNKTLYIVAFGDIVATRESLMRSWLTCSPFRSAQPIRPDLGMYLFLLPKLFLGSRLFPNLHPHVWIREKLLWNEKFQLSLSLRTSLLSKESPPHAITVVSWGTSDLSAHIGKRRGRQIGKLLKLPCVTNNHVRPRGPPPQKKPFRHHGTPPRNPIPRYQ
jgi:hypothetical protein